MQFAKFISKDCAAGAPDLKNGEPYTEEMARADGFLPLVTVNSAEDFIRPKVQYKIENDTVIEYYIENDEPIVDQPEENLDENHPIDEKDQITIN